MRQPPPSQDTLEVGPDGSAALPAPSSQQRAAARVRARARLSPIAPALSRSAVPLAVYAATRVGLGIVLALNAALRHLPVQTQAAHFDGAWLSQVAHWDGAWYSLLALIGYPHHPPVGQSTLGFFPLYPAVIRVVAYPVSWLTGQGMTWSTPTAGFVVSTIGGAVAVVLVHELARCWWGPESGRRAAIFFCVVPGSVVFSMSYAEGLMLPLAAGCLLALQHQRWYLAGALAALATATEPEGLGLVVACAIPAVRALSASGLRSPEFRARLVAPLLSVTGLGALAVFLWAWTGTPLATLHAQHSAWGESTTGFAIVGLTRNLVSQLHLHNFNHPTIDLNLVSGFVGAIILVVLLGLLVRYRHGVSGAALAWTLCIAFLAVTSQYIPPNPRMIITAFPAVMVLGRAVRGRAFVALAAASGALLMLLSALTFVGSTLRP